MKRLLLFVIIFSGLVVPHVNAQTSVYHPFPDSYAVWRVNSWVLCSDNSTSYSYYQYTMEGDTTIGSYTYKKIYESGMYSDCPPDTLFTYNYNYKGALRQDTINKKVYFKRSSSSCPDTILYDFSKQVGDTLNLILCTSSNTYTISSIDSVLVGNNYHKQFHLLGGMSFDTNTLIEGVGATSGLLELLYLGPHEDTYLVCFSHELDIYPASAGSCTLISGITESSQINNEVNIYPNPATNKLYIEHTNSDATEITLFNILGKQVTTTIKTTEQKTEMDVSGLSEGVYFLKVTDNSNSITRKIIIQQ